MTDRPILKSLLLLGATFLGAQAAYAQNSGEIISSNPADPEFNFIGFGDISYISRDGSSQDGFVIGQAVAHVSAALGNSLSIFGEFSATGKDSGYSMEVERLIVKYDFSDLFTPENPVSEPSASPTSKPSAPTRTIEVISEKGIWRRGPSSTSESCDRSRSQAM